MARSRDSGSWIGLLILPAIVFAIIIYIKIHDYIEKKADSRAAALLLQAKNQIDNYEISAHKKADDYFRKQKDEFEKYVEQEKNRIEHSKRSILDEAEHHKRLALDFSNKTQSTARETAKKSIEEADRILRDVKYRLDIQENLFAEKTIGFPWVASAYKKIVLEHGNLIAEILENKRNPSLKGAETVREFSKLAAEAKKEKFIFQGLTEYYESLFPWLTDFRDLPDEVISQSKKTELKGNDDDPASRFLSGAEWENLSDAEKYQKSLDRYWKRKKSNWEIGRDFERFIGFEYEELGWDVIYFGAIKGFEDLGRDVIAKNKNEVHIVQCKYWASDKIIHEKHLFQLFGTSVVYKIENELSSYPKAIFVASCSLSDTAKSVAAALDIKVIEKKKMTQFPCIKCNIGNSGEKIYHLPFDQQYDKIKIEKHKGEFYCATIEEAERAGFRRAFRWKGNKS